MGYEVLIARSAEWAENGADGGISLAEWKNYIASDDSMRIDGTATLNLPNGQTLTYSNDGLSVWLGYPGHEDGGNQAWFDFRRGAVWVKNPDAEVLRKMHKIASDLNARVFGEEGEEYGADGAPIGDSASSSSDAVRKPWWRIW